MSLYGMMRTGVSGMNAQSNRLSTGRRQHRQFEHHRLQARQDGILVAGHSERAGQLQFRRREDHGPERDIERGVLQFTTSGSDLAINGNGFFVVQDARARPSSPAPVPSFRTAPAASSTPPGSTSPDNNFANGEPSAVTNGFNGLEVVSIANFELSAEASTSGTFTAHCGERGGRPAANLPSANGTNAQHSAKSSWSSTTISATEIPRRRLLLEDRRQHLGSGDLQPGGCCAEHVVPLCGSRPRDADARLRSDVGKLTAGSATDIQFTVPNGEAPDNRSGCREPACQHLFRLHVLRERQRAERIENVDISSDGTMYAQYENGSLKALYKIPLATVQSPRPASRPSGKSIPRAPTPAKSASALPAPATPASSCPAALEGLQCRHRRRADRHDRGAAQLHRAIRRSSRPDPTFSTSS